MALRPLDLGWLRIIAEVGKSRSLTLAAERLGMTQPGVSYQIRRLEGELGVPLVRRHHRGVDLTAEGQRLFETVARQVSELDRLADEFQGGRRKRTVRLHTDYAFSALWMMPRMGAFRERHPEINLQIIATQSPQAQYRDDGDILVVFGSRADAGEGAQLLLSEQVMPVCTPQFRARHGLGGDAAGLAGQTLIHLDSLSPSWFTWSAYLERLGITRTGQPAQGDISFNTYSLVVQAALGEQGVALGWAGLVDDMIAAGTLVPAGPVVTAAERGYWLAAPRKTEAEAEKLVDWLTGEAGKA